MQKKIGYSNNLMAIQWFYSYANKHRTTVSPVGALLEDADILHYDYKAMSEVPQKQYCSYQQCLLISIDLGFKNKIIPGDSW